MKSNQITFRGKITEWIYIPKKDYNKISFFVNNINKLKTVKIKAKKWSDEGKTHVYLTIDKTFSIDEIIKFLKEGKKFNEDRTLYAGSINQKLFEVHYSRDNKFVFIKNGKVEVLSNFESVLRKISRIPEVSTVKVSQYMSNDSDIAKKYKFNV